MSSSHDHPDLGMPTGPHFTETPILVKASPAVTLPDIIVEEPFRHNEEGKPIECSLSKYQPSLTLELYEESNGMK